MLFNGLFVNNVNQIPVYNFTQTVDVDNYLDGVKNIIDKVLINLLSVQMEI